MDVLAVAVSGLKAQQQRVAASANNIANATTSGAVPSEQAPAASTVYRPLSVSLIPQTAGDLPGGVRAEVIENKDAYSLVYDPKNPVSNADGFIAAPNVDFVQESINIMESKEAFKANVAVIRAEKEMQDSLMDVLA